MSSEQRRKKQLEKKKAKRVEKAKERYSREHVPLDRLPLKHAFVNPDWKKTRYAFVVVSRVHQDGGYEVCEFLIDCDGFGLNDCLGPRHFAPEAYDAFVKRGERAAIDPAAASAMVHAAIAWAGRFRFPLPKSARKALDILPEAGKNPIEFGRDGEPFLRGEETAIRQRLAQAGLHAENFKTEFFQAAPRGTTFGFASEERLRHADGNDPLVRLERLAALADGYERQKKLKEAEDLHRTMEALAAQCDRLPRFLKYLSAYLIRQERMERVLAVLERIVEVTAEPAAKALARLDLADFMRYMGDALGADDIYRKVLADVPELWEAKLRYAAFLCHAARRDEGVQVYRDLIAAAKGRPEAREALGRAYQELYTMLSSEDRMDEAAALAGEAAKDHGIRCH
ncbi:MAG TPA: hypothetical protein DCM87_15060 [Planctomycetes bacterium]|nr:hypothetical protein [Planctomycetota bacterium]